MKKITGLCILYLLISSFSLLRSKKLLETFKIGEYTYKIYDEEGFVNTAKEQSHFYVLYREGRSASLCSAYISTVKDGKTITKGTYLHTSEYIEFKEHYTGSKLHADSMMKRYYPDENGGLKLKELTRYRGGDIDKFVYEN